MNIALRFKESYEVALTHLSEDEWATARVRDQIIDELQVWEAFDAVPDVMQLALEQGDGVDLTEYCWFILGLLSKANTTEIHPRIAKLLPQLEDLAARVGGQSSSEVEKIAQFLRLPANKSSQPTPYRGG